MKLKKQFLQDYTKDFELNGLMIIGPVEHKTNIRYKNMNDFESYINATDIDSDSENVTFTENVYKLNTPQFNVVKRSAYLKVLITCNKIVEYLSQNRYFPTSGHCFIKCIIFFPMKNIRKNFQRLVQLNKEALT